MAELNALVGLDKVKEEFVQLVDYLNIAKLKESHGIQSQSLSLHMVFSGNPGTGKTTVARLVGKVFKSIGLLEKGHVVENDRSALVGEYIGQTAKKTKAKLEEAIGGILFVDEAYALKADGKSDFGDEALETILKYMEDHREKLVVIFAGYPKEMEELLNSNPGLKSRFATHLTFEDFSAEELMNILKKMMLKSSHFLSVEAEESAIKYLNYLAGIADRFFGNAREVRNLFEDLLKAQSSRLAKLISSLSDSSEKVSEELLREITLEDLRSCYQFSYEENAEDNLSDLLAELNQLIGLASIKKELEELTQFLAIHQKRKEAGLISEFPTLHAAFIGPPGTGKTTVARLLARIYKCMGILKKGHLVEAARQDLVAAYVGQTAVKTNTLIDSAMHGLLFIDEAYSLSDKGKNDFGNEAIEVLLKRMEDDRENFVVVVAGYQKPMQKFLNSNPGLPSRFTRQFHFPNFTATELKDIFLFHLKRSTYTLDREGELFLQKEIYNEQDEKQAYFGNARWVRKLLESCKIAQAQRLSQVEFVNEQELQQITKADLEAAFSRLKNNEIEEKTNKIGF
ncbi:MAG: AAA family ATPase [Vicingaceae bacterium]